MRRAVRRARRLAVALWRFARLPRWLAVVLAAALAIPGPVDDVAVMLVIGFVIAWQLRTRRNRARFARYMRAAWYLVPAEAQS